MSSNLPATLRHLSDVMQGVCIEMQMKGNTYLCYTSVLVRGLCGLKGLLARLLADDVEDTILEGLLVL